MGVLSVVVYNTRYMSEFFSIIVPIYNEAGNITPLFEKIRAVMKPFSNWEVIFVNDGSYDESDVELQRLCHTYPRVRVIEFVRNFGQTAAWAAGFDHAKGDYLITLDGDGQNDPGDIPRMIELMKKKQADVVTGWRKHRKDPFIRGLMSQVANGLVNWLTGSHIRDTGCSLRILKKAVVENLVLYGEMHRLLPFLLSGYGVRMIETPVHHHPRTIGKSKYGLSRMFKVVMDVIVVKFLVSYRTKPIYMFGSLGSVFLVLSGIFSVLVVVRKIAFGGEWISPIFFVMTNFFTIGVVLIMMGLMMEVQVRTWFEGTGKKSYEVKK